MTSDPALSREARTAPPPLSVGAPRTGLTLLATCLGAMMTFLQITASATALGPIQDDLHLSPAALVWVPSAYTLMVASLVLSAGTLGNLHGRKRVFQLGVLVMIAGSLTAYGAHSPATVVTGQLLSGVGAALILPNSLAILGAAFPDPHRRTEMVTAWAASSGVGLAIGPLIAGLLLDHYRWNTVFLSTVALGALTVTVTGAFVTESRQPGSRLDVPGQLLAVLGVAALVYALIQGGHDGYASARILAAWALAALALAAFVLVERGTLAPMLDVRLFRSRSFSAVMLVAAVSLFAFTGVAILSVLYYERVQRLSALAMGWRVLVLFAVYVAVAYGAGRLIRRTGFKLPLTAGLLLGAATTLGLTTQDPATAYARVWWLYALFGAACGLMAAPSTAAALVSVPHERAGMASGAVNALRQIGSVMGSSLLGTLLASRLTARLPAQLAAHGVLATTRPAIEHAVATGAPAAGPLPAAVTGAINDAFTSGIHTALAVTAALLAATAVIAALFVHNRPHTTAR